MRPKRWWPEGDPSGGSIAHHKESAQGSSWLIPNAPQGKTELLLSRAAAPQNSVNCQKCNFTFSSDIYAPKVYVNFEYRGGQAARPKDRSTNRSKSIDRGSTTHATKKTNSWLTPLPYTVVRWMNEWMDLDMSLMDLISQEKSHFNHALETIE